MDFLPTPDDPSEFDPRNPFKGDERIPVQFRMDALKDDGASETAARPIYRDVEFIKIMNGKDNVIDRPVRDTDKQRWPRAYAAWKNTGVSDPASMGTRRECGPRRRGPRSGVSLLQFTVEWPTSPTPRAKSGAPS
jgi:hypothetical protein